MVTVSRLRCSPTVAPDSVATLASSCPDRRLRRAFIEGPSLRRRVWLTMEMCSAFSFSNPAGLDAWPGRAGPLWPRLPSSAACRSK